jgi:hypothetical protein
MQWVLEAFSPEVKRLGCEADHSLLSGAEAKNAWGHISTPQYVFMEWCLAKKWRVFIVWFLIIGAPLFYHKKIFISC